jgi:hypothetical protein
MKQKINIPQELKLKNSIDIFSTVNIPSPK